MDWPMAIHKQEENTLVNRASGTASKIVMGLCFGLTLVMGVSYGALAQDAPVETAAILPWHYESGTDGAVKTGKEFLHTLLVKSRVDETSEVKTTAAWEETNGTAWDQAKWTMPSPAQMLRVGQKLGVDWVITGSARWHTKSVWIGLGPKTKSDCTVDCIIVDVKKGEVALDVKDIRMESTAKEDALKAIGAVFVSSLFTVVSGGPKTPHEQRAVQLATAKAMQPWLTTHLKVKKIDPRSK